MDEPFTAIFLRWYCTLQILQGTHEKYRFIHTFCCFLKTSNSQKEQHQCPCQVCHFNVHATTNGKQQGCEIHTEGVPSICASWLHILQVNLPVIKKKQKDRLWVTHVKFSVCEVRSHTRCTNSNFYLHLNAAKQTWVLCWWALLWLRELLQLLSERAVCTLCLAI